MLFPALSVTLRPPGVTLGVTGADGVVTPSCVLLIPWIKFLFKEKVIHTHDGTWH